MSKQSQLTNWYLYLIRCPDQSLYTGISTDPERRFLAHQQGKGARYLRGKSPLKLVFQAAIGTKAQAAQWEHYIKGLSKAQKEALVAGEISLQRLRFFTPEASNQEPA